MSSRGLNLVWPNEDCTRVPFEVFFDRELYETELDRIFSGPHWQYLALDQEIALQPVMSLRPKYGMRMVLESRL